MDLDESQRAAISAGVRVPRRLEPRRTKINGPAGTGKTTIIREVLASGVGDGAVVLAPTNKAAHVLRGKGIPAQTITLRALPAEVGGPARSTQGHPGSSHDRRPVRRRADPAPGSAPRRLEPKADPAGRRMTPIEERLTFSRTRSLIRR